MSITSVGLQLPKARLKRFYLASRGMRESLASAYTVLCRPEAESVLLQLAEWIEDYNTRAPHSPIGMRSPAA